MNPEQIHLSAETDSEEQCEGLVVTCAHCGRPVSECDGANCEAILETRDWMVPGYTRKPEPPHAAEASAAL